MYRLIQMTILVLKNMSSQNTAITSIWGHRSCNDIRTTILGQTCLFFLFSWWASIFKVNRCMHQLPKHVCCPKKHWFSGAREMFRVQHMLFDGRVTWLSRLPWCPGLAASHPTLPVLWRTAVRHNIRSTFRHFHSITEVVGAAEISQHTTTERSDDRGYQVRADRAPAEHDVCGALRSTKVDSAMQHMDEATGRARARWRQVRRAPAERPQQWQQLSDARFAVAELDKLTKQHDHCHFTTGSMTMFHTMHTAMGSLENWWSHHRPHLHWSQLDGDYAKHNSGWTQHGKSTTYKIKQALV